MSEEAVEGREVVYLERREAAVQAGLLVARYEGEVEVRAERLADFGRALDLAKDARAFSGCDAIRPGAVAPLLDPGEIERAVFELGEGGRELTGNARAERATSFEKLDGGLTEAEENGELSKREAEAFAKVAGVGRVPFHEHSVA